MTSRLVMVLNHHAPEVPKSKRGDLNLGTQKATSLSTPEKTDRFRNADSRVLISTSLLETGY